jgi:peroxiredoxin
MESASSLQNQLDQFKASWATRVGNEIARTIEDDIAALRATSIIENAIKEGASFPQVTNLVDAHNQPFNLSALIAERPVIITFYRGGWCPYCNLELRAYQALLPAIQSMGAELVAISPERPDLSLSTAEKNDLSFKVLSDVDGVLARALGIQFTLSETAEALYRKWNHDLTKMNNTDEWTLPLPATYVVARGGEIMKACLEADYRKRLDPHAAIGVLVDKKRLAA